MEKLSGSVPASHLPGVRGGLDLTHSGPGSPCLSAAPLALEDTGGSERDAEAPLQRRGGPGADTSVTPRPCSVLFLPGDLGCGLSPGRLSGTADFGTECETKHLVQQFLLLLLKKVWILFLSH